VYGKHKNRIEARESRVRKSREGIRCSWYSTRPNKTKREEDKKEKLAKKQKKEEARKENEERRIAVQIEEKKEEKKEKNNKGKKTIQVALMLATESRIQLKRMR